MGTKENKATVELFDQLTAVGEIDGLDAICMPDMINHALAEHRTPGLEGSKEFLRECERDPGKAVWRRGMIGDQQVTAVAEGDYVIQFGRRAGTWPGGRFRASRFPPATTRTTSRSCTGSAEGGSPNGGPCVTTSG